MVQVLFDNKNVTGVMTNDKLVHLIWPGFTEGADLDPFDFFLDAAGAQLFGRTKFGEPADPGDPEVKLVKGSDVLFHHPFNPLNVSRVRFTQKTVGSFHADDREILFYKDPTDIVNEKPALKPLQFVKFPEIHYDEDSDQIFLFYWTNVPATALDTIITDFETRELAGEDVTNDEQNFSIIAQAAEPFQDSGEVSSTLQRVMAFTKGEQADLYDNRRGPAVIVHRPSTFIFERPRLVLRPGPFEETNPAEPVLDVHTGGQVVFLDFRTLT